jgi:hypothetical protein
MKPFCTSIWIVSIGLGFCIWGCGGKKGLRPDGTSVPSTIPSVRDLGEKVQWRVKVGSYTLGSVVGHGAGDMPLGLDMDLKSMMQRDLSAAWGLLVPEGTNATQAPLKVLIQVKEISVNWSAGFGVDVIAVVRLTTEIWTNEPTPRQLVTNESESLQKETFFGGGTVGNDWKNVLQLAYRDAMAKLVQDSKLLAQLDNPPPIVLASNIGSNPGSATPGTTSSSEKPIRLGTKFKGVIVAAFDIQDSSKKFSADVLDQLTDYLAAKLTELGGMKVVPRDQIRNRLREEKKETYKQCYEQSCQIDLGKALAAEKTLSTKLLRIGNQCAITCILYDLKTETTDQAASVDTACSESALMGAMAEIARKLTGAS